jgi:hypothetical protein
MHGDPEGGHAMRRPRLEIEKRLPRYFAEMLIGLVLAALIVLALVATVGSVPFIYQGY